MITDPHPHAITFKFDREKLRRYLRMKWLLGWLAGIGGLGFLMSIPAAIDSLQRNQAPLAEKLPVAALALGLVLAGALALALLCYFVFSHFQAATQARDISLQVEGAFLRFSKGGLIKTDRKLHFRAIVDYAVVEGPLLRRHGLKTLHMTLAALGPNALLVVPGLCECDAVRDQLAEIDAAREHAHG